MGVGRGFGGVRCGRGRRVGDDGCVLGGSEELELAGEAVDLVFVLDGACE